MAFRLISTFAALMFSFAIVQTSAVLIAGSNSSEDDEGRHVEPPEDCSESETSCTDGIDNDCDGFNGCADAECVGHDFCLDQDLDFYTPEAGDCDDQNDQISPAKLESCDNAIDDNCDGTTNENCTIEICSDGSDNDSDESIDCLDSDCLADTECIDSDFDGYTPNGGDCNDNDNLANPGMIELCGNLIDDNCNGFFDEFCVPTFKVR